MDAEGIAKFEAEMDGFIASARGSGRPEPKKSTPKQGEPFIWCRVTSLFITPGVKEHSNPAEVLEWAARHFTGDFGDLCAEDLQANMDAIRQGLRVLSVYHAAKDGEKVYIITEADRSSTTVLLASEY